MKCHRVALLCGLLLFAAGPILAADWGTIQGQVIWGGAAIPERKPLNVDKDQGVCLKHGPILDQKFVIDKESKGVKWVMVWLADARQPKNPKAEIPIHPALKELKTKTVILDQPVCVYEPHVLGLRVGQTLVAKNSSTIAHNIKIDGGVDNPNLNPIVPPGAEVKVEGWNPTRLGPVPISCSIHGWMNAFVRVFNHPYFAVTNDKGEFEIKDAPAGEFRLVIWHPEGFVLPGRLEGMPITIKANSVTQVGQIKFNPS